MKKKGIILIFVTILLTVIVLIQKSFAWESKKLDKNKTNVTIQSNYIENDATIAVALKSANVYGEGNNKLTKNELIEAVKGKYGVNIIKNVYKTDGVTSIENTECVGTGYKVQLVTNKMLTVILYGDVNCNGIIDTDDTVVIAKHNVNILKLNKYQEKAAHLTVKKSTKVPAIDTDDTVRVAFYNVNGLGKGHAGETIVDSALYPADKQFESGAEVENINDADDTYKTALSKFTKNEFTKNNDELKLNNGKLEGTVNYNFAVEKDVFPEEELTGYYFGYVIKAQGANENTTLKIKNSDKEVKEIPYASFDTTEGISMIASLSKTVTNKKIEIEVDLDGAGTLYKPYTKIIDYSNLQFGDMVSATITHNIPKEDAEELEGSKWNYRFEFSHSHSEGEGYNIEKVEKNKYKINGIVTEQEQVTGFSEEEKTKYYLVFAIEPNYISDNISIKLPLRNGNYKQVGKSSLRDDKLTAIISIDESGTKSFKILVDLDGDGNRFQEEEITIDYNDLEFEKSSQFEIKKELPSKGNDNGSAVKTELNNLGFKPEDYFSLIGGKDNLEITVDKLNKQFYTITGTIPRMTGVNAGFKDEENGGYYIVFTVKTHSSGNDDEEQNSINEKVKITFTSPAEGDNSEVRVLDKSSFDTATEMAVLWKLNETRNEKDKTLKVTIDLDGDEKEYAPYHVILDYSDVVFQEESTAKISFEENTLSEKQKEEFKNYGYKFQDEIKLSEGNSHLSDGKKGELKYNAKTGLLSGIAKEQVLTNGYAEEDLDSYFFTYTITPENVTEEDIKNIKVTIKNSQNDDEHVEKTFTYEDFDGGKLNILQHIPKGFKKCVDTDCCNGDGTCSDAEKCKNSLKVIVDIDGDDNYEYKPSQVYYIDYCNLDFVDLHTVTFENKDKTPVKDESGEKIDEALVYDGEKVSEPAVPKMEKLTETEPKYSKFSYWRIGKTEETYDDYSKKYEFDNKKSKQPITEDITLFPMWEVDVDGYISEAINEINNKEQEKKDFEIEKNEYNITVDIENRNKDIDSITDTGIADVVAHALMYDEIKEIDLELSSVSDTSLKIKHDEIKNEVNSEYTESKVKEKVKEKLKEYFKKESLSSTTHTLDSLCTTCSGKELNLSIEPDETIANIKGKENKQSVTYNIKFEKENIVSFDSGSMDQSIDDSYLKDNETLAKLPSVTIPEELQDVREFIGWYDGNGEIFTTSTPVTKDVELTAHYKLYLDTFMDKVVSDLNSAESQYSGNFQDKFTLEKSENNITIKLNKANVPLNELAKTSIPGTIAYILQKGEIKDITLKVDEQAKKFDVISKQNLQNVAGVRSTELNQQSDDLKNKIISEAKEAFNNVLEGNEATATLDEVEFEKKGFSIEIGNTNENVKLYDKKENGHEITLAEEKKYEFNLDSDFVVVSSSELGAKTIDDALEADGYNDIYIGSDITITGPIDLNKNITIESLEDEMNDKVRTTSVETKTIKNTNGENIFNITGTTNVEIGNLTLEGNKSANFTLENNSNTGAIKVGNGSSLTAYGLKYNDENYYNPVIKAETGATVNVSDTENGNKKSGIKEEKITRYESLSEDEKKHYKDKRESAGKENTNYYSNDNNSRVYEVTFRTTGRPYVGYLTRYYFNGEKPTAPEDKNKSIMKVFDTYTYEGMVYTADKFSKSIDGSQPIDRNNLPVVDGANVTYYPVYTTKLSEDAAEVGDVKGFKDALNKSEVKDIYIKNGVTLDFTGETESSGTLTLKKSVIGRGNAGIKAKKIVIEKDSNTNAISLDRLNIEVTEANVALIEAKYNKVDILSCKIKNSGSSNTVDAVKITPTEQGKIEAEIKWCDFYGNNVKNYINLDGEVTGTYERRDNVLDIVTGTYIYGNTFGAIEKANKDGLASAEAQTQKTEDADIVIKNVENSKQITISSNTYTNSKNKYRVKLGSEIAKTTGACLILRSIKNEFNVGLEAKESSTNFSNFKLKTNNELSLIKQFFIAGTGTQATTEKLDN